MRSVFLFGFDWDMLNSHSLSPLIMFFFDVLGLSFADSVATRFTQAGVSDSSDPTLRFFSYFISFAQCLFVYLLLSS